MHRTPFKQLRSKFADDLENILECPVCLSRLEGSVPQCLQGHNVCIKCYVRLQPRICPLCKRNFHGTRNFLAEDLLSKFQQIQTSLADPFHRINETAVKNKMCIGTQTSPIAPQKANVLGLGASSPKDLIRRSARLALRAINNIGNQNKKIKDKVSAAETQASDVKPSTATEDIVTVKAGAGKYPCRIKGCNESLPHRLLLPHLYQEHAKFVIDVGVVSGTEYTIKLKLQFKRKTNYDSVIHIANMGVFFVKIVFSEEGDVQGHVLLSNSQEKAQRFLYTMSIGKNGTFITYEGKVLASRKFIPNVSKGLLIPKAGLAELIPNPKLLDCRLRIKYS